MIIRRVGHVHLRGETTVISDWSLDADAALDGRTLARDLAPLTSPTCAECVTYIELAGIQIGPPLTIDDVLDAHDLLRG